jgi:hypothetical protein
VNVPNTGYHLKARRADSAGLIRNSRTGRLTLALLLAVLAVMALWTFAAAEDSSPAMLTPRCILRVDQEGLPAEGAEDLGALIRRAPDILDAAAAEIMQRLGAQPLRQAVLRFVARSVFDSQLKAPSWTTGMYYRGEIIIPVSAVRGDPSEAELVRTLRHEYVHLLLAELSAQRSPAWLDEGLAQILEGPPSSALEEALGARLRRKPSVRLRDLQRGFTALAESNVAAAYAHSFAAASFLTRRHGMPELMRYLKSLGTGQKAEEAFARSFGESQCEFEAAFEAELRGRLARGGDLLLRSES